MDTKVIITAIHIAIFVYWITAIFFVYQGKFVLPPYNKIAGSIIVAVFCFYLLIFNTYHIPTNKYFRKFLVGSLVAIIPIFKLISHYNKNGSNESDGSNGYKIVDGSFERSDEYGNIAIKLPIIYGFAYLLVDQILKPYTRNFYIKGAVIGILFLLYRDYISIPILISNEDYEQRKIYIIIPIIYALLYGIVVKYINNIFKLPQSYVLYY